MNDDIREKLSAYLDGALPDEERRSLEVEVSRSEELRLELEALRAVSAAVKGLPKEKLPAGFLARLEARRAREDASPTREYFILPPSYRPLAFALSTAVVALVIWDKTVTRPDPVAPHVGWDGDRVAVKSAAEAPPSIDVSAQLSDLDERRKSSGDAPAASDELTAQTAKKEDAGQFKGGAASTFGKNVSAPGKPLEVAEADGIAASGGAGGSVAGMISGAAGLSAPASAPAPAAAARRAAPAGAQGEPAEGKANAFSARNEEERSAINEQLYQGFEAEKKRMGIAKIMDKDAEEEELPSGGREFMALQGSPESPRLDRNRSVGPSSTASGRGTSSPYGSVASVRGAASSKAKAGVPAFRAIALKTPEALAAAWAAAGLPGEPPAVNFPEQMALFLAGPSGCGIVDVRARKNTLLVLYKSEGFDDPSARVRAVALSPKPVLIKLAP